MNCVLTIGVLGFSILGFIAPTVWGFENLSSYFQGTLSDQEQSVLQEEGVLQDFRDTLDEIGFALPQESVQSLIQDLPREHFNILFEALYFLPIDANIDPKQLYNALNAISQLKGIEYFSSSRQKDRVLFLDAYRIASAKGLFPKKDLLITESKTIPTQADIFIFLEDSSFGGYRNRVRYHHFPQEDMFFLSLTNVTPIKYWLVPLLPKEQLQMYVWVKYLEEGLVFYGLASAKTLEFMGLEQRYKGLIRTRINTVYRWFEEQMQELAR